MKKLPLYIPVSYTKATYNERLKVVNGCGAKDGVKVPDTFWFMSIKKSCNIHDWMFHEGRTLGDYYFANTMFLWNLFALIYNGSNWLTMTFRLPRMVMYFLGVMSSSGEDAYWVEGKRKNDILTITIQGEYK